MYRLPVSSPDWGLWNKRGAASSIPLPASGSSMEGGALGQSPQPLPKVGQCSFWGKRGREQRQLLPVSSPSKLGTVQLGEGFASLLASPSGPVWKRGAKPPDPFPRPSLWSLEEPAESNEWLFLPSPLGLHHPHTFFRWGRNQFQEGTKACPLAPLLLGPGRNNARTVYKQETLPGHLPSWSQLIFSPRTAMFGFGKKKSVSICALLVPIGRMVMVMVILPNRN